jgi:hypothetical protein
LAAVGHAPPARDDCADSPSPVQSEVDQAADATSEETDSSQTVSEPSLAPILDEPVNAPLGTATEENTRADLQSVDDPPPPMLVCAHASTIRAEAVRLAIVACGRALRHVAVVHPKLVVAFVNDALAVAGNPEGAKIHAVADSEGSDLGDVLIEYGESQIGADLTMRAELLVRAVADA